LPAFESLSVGKTPALAHLSILEKSEGCQSINLMVIGNKIRLHKDHEKVL